jgi:hypothetical protein
MSKAVSCQQFVPSKSLENFLQFCCDAIENFELLGPARFS